MQTFNKHEVLGMIDKVRNLMMDVENDIARETPCHWHLEAWRCRTRSHLGAMMEANSLTGETWEKVPELVHTLLEWQLEGNENPMPDPGPIQIRYVPEGGIPGTGGF